MKKLNPSYVLIPFQELIGNSQNNVLMGLRLVEKIDKFPEPTAEEMQFMQIYFNGHITEITKSKSLFKDWLLKNGFEDINNAIRTTMERLFVYKSIEAKLKEDPNFDFEELQGELAIKANKENFPNLMKRVNGFFEKPLDYTDSMMSLNNARNCFVHRNGIVGEKDLNNEAIDKLEILGNRFKMFFKKGNEEIIAELGKPGPENAALMLGAENFKIEFEKGQKIDFTLKEFLAIINTCVFIKADIEVRIKNNVA